jgi:hypothetical protein
MFGFKMVDGMLEVVPEEAEVLRLFADLYLEGYGQIQLERALERAGVCGRRGGIMRANVLKDLLFNEKTAGDLLLQKVYISDPIDKKACVNRGERPQYFVRDSHEAILDRETYDRLLAERKRRAEKYLPVESRGPRRVYPFTGKLVCGHCGANFRRKTVHDGDKCRVFWICGTFNNKGKTHCNARQIPEAILEGAAAQALGIAEFNAELFKEAVSGISAPEDGILFFSLKSGADIRVEWENKSRRYSWTPEMRRKAQEDALRGNREKGCVAQ